MLAGALIGLLSWQVRRRMDDPMLESIAMLVTPFAAFLLADAVHASGVLAVVVCGLFMSQVTPRITGAATRQIVIPFWALSTTVLSSALFVLIGLSAQSAVPRPEQHLHCLRALVDVLVVTAVVIGVRWVWVYTTPYLIRLLDRRPAQRLRRVPARQRTVSAVAGFRGAVSLAAVLAVPHTLDSGAPFPDRDLIVLITCGVIVLTLLQALLLPSVVRFARLPVDTSVAEELQFADEYTLDAAIEALDTTASELGSGETVVERVRHELDKQRKLLAAAGCRRRPGRPARRPVHEPLARPHRPPARGAPRAARRAAHRRHRAAPGAGPSRHRGGAVPAGEPSRVIRIRTRGLRSRISVRP